MSLGFDPGAQRFYGPSDSSGAGEGVPIEGKDFGTSPLPKASQCTVLILDDHADIRTSMRVPLRSYGFENILLAGSEAEACRLAGEHSLDLIVSDVKLGEAGDSNRAVARMKDLYPAAVVIRMSGHAEYLLDAPGDFHVVKTDLALETQAILQRFFELN